MGQPIIPSCQVKLDAGNQPRFLHEYCDSVISYCSDFGTESQFTEVPNLTAVDSLIELIMADDF